MRPRLFLFVVLFFLFSCILYIDSIIYRRLKSPPFYWDHESINTINDISIFIQFFSIFLGGICAAFIFPVPVILMISFASILIGVLLFDITAMYIHGDSAVVGKGVFDQINAPSVIIFYVLYGIFAGISKFILLVMLFDQKEETTLEYASTGFLFILNLSAVFVYDFLPKMTVSPLLYVSLPLILVTTVLLLIGRLRRNYWLDVTQISIVKILFEGIGKSKTKTDYLTFSGAKMSIPRPNLSTTNLHDRDLEESDDRRRDTFLSFSRLCFMFMVLLPYGICTSQLTTTFAIQYNYLLQPNSSYYAIVGDFWSMTINCVGVVVIIPLVVIFRHFFEWFDRIYSIKTFRLISGNIAMLLSVLSAGVLETIRLNMYWGTDSAIVPSNRMTPQQIDNRDYNATNLSVFYMTPQLLLNSIADIFVYTTCAEFMYKHSVSSMKYLSVAVFLGTIGTGSAGNVISLVVTMLLSGQLFNSNDINERKIYNQTCCTYQSRLDRWFYILGAFFSVTLLLNVVLLRKFRHYFDPVSDLRLSQECDGFVND